MAALHVFPDTNLLIHFKRLDQIDWRRLTGASEVVIVLAPVVVEELDDLKNRQDSRKIRQRARDLNSWVRERWRDPNKVLREGVRLEFGASEDDEHLTGGLLARIKDDRLIASALGYAADGKDAALATNDTGPLIKAEARGLRVIEPPADLALPLERDEVERERDDLRRKQDAERSRAPKLQVALLSRLGGGQFAVAARPALATPDEIVRNHPLMRKRGEPNTGGFAGLNQFAPLGVPASAVESYNASLRRFYVLYENAYQQAVEALDFNRRIIELNFQLENVGGASATDLMIRADFPPGLIANDDLKPMQIPRPPEPPEPPSAYGLAAPRDLKPGRLISVEHVYQPLVSNLPIYDPWAPKIDAEGRRATWRDRQLLHGDQTDLRSLPCLVAAELIGKTVEIQFAIHCSDLMRPIEQALTVSFIESAEAE